MTKDENKLLKAMKARQISMNRKMDKITSDGPRGIRDHGVPCG